MIEHKILEILTSKLEDYIEQYQSVLNDGAATDYAQYKDLCGAIRGLKMAQMEIKELGKNMRDSEDQE
jgi:hypothetical protein|tara:strand:- start:1058 stop:1261 length:204 start_codon:yes stop_codon:yes gene_type:complete